MSRSAALLSRRDLLSGHPGRQPGPLPPGVSVASLAACTGCGDCIAACPQRILLIVDGRVGVDFGHGECTFCGACAEACPEPVFDGTAAMAHAVVITDACLARAGIACMTCRDACPADAISFRPRTGGPFLPVLDPAACTGCGACIAPCPADAITTSEIEAADV